VLRQQKALNERDMGVDERAEWKRQSNVDFRSFRRWFTTKPEQAGQLPYIIDAVTGYKRPGEMLGRYSQGPSLAQLRACVLAVVLPIAVEITPENPRTRPHLGHA